MKVNFPQHPERIDTHQHFWQLGRFAYSWLTPKLNVLYRDYLPAEFLPQMAASGIRRSLLVQADSSTAETAWLLELAEQNPTIAGVVGWVNLAVSDLEKTLTAFQEAHGIKGVRPDTPKSDLAIESMLPGLRLLGRLGLTCDLLCNPKSLKIIQALVEQAPGTQFIVDHLGGGTIIPGGSLEWGKSMQPLARLPNVALKVSGYLAYAQPRPPLLSTLRPYIASALDLFGTERLVFGSDWPVCTQGGAYIDAVNLLQSALSEINPLEQAAIWGGNAVRIYHLA
jgi:L-fuconolactonase